MSHANTISAAFGHDTALAMKAASRLPAEVDQLCASETTVWTFEDGSKLAVSESDVWEVVGRRQEMILELMEARERGVNRVWYGHIENAEPVAIEDAIRDLRRMDDFDTGDWGEYLWSGR